ncbi:sensor histidine kinase [Rhodococcus triatomae]|uniref:histidine kinase n=1 Tax=Rhodococcus triatomae TaxID=300028 RepID=A0A1G8QNB2_9NOCA|nr:sensor histidine kinase [Rhodococcus triatomae]QNG20621.1 sensor histidine kinase [Rhodococcus triatomae]QNG23461.1 sensor histidine kinase [Rhodococcus triatomae]SDJ06123.1 Signal transduction histidine kinase [Rhodococcus triatomae]
MTGLQLRDWWWRTAQFGGAVFVFVVVLHTLTSDTGLSDRSAAILALCQGGAVALVVVSPLGGVMLALGAVVVASLAEPGQLWVDPVVNSYLVVLALAGLRVRPRVAVGMWTATVAAGVALAGSVRPPEALRDFLEISVLAALVLVAGGAVRAALEARSRLTAEQEATERERERGAALAERTRIARELHDVVVHHMSVVAIQAQAARYRIQDPPSELVAGLEAIRASASEALGEMRRILGVLRADDADDLLAPPRPAPTLSDIDGLVSGIRSTGTTVDLEVGGAARPLPAGIEMSAYRIVQEALSNAVRHSPGSVIRVEIDYEEEDLVVLVQNGPGTSPGTESASAGGGQGQIGMRERVDSLKGQLTAGPTGGGGYRVHVRIPATPRERESREQEPRERESGGGSR